MTTETGGSDSDQAAAIDLAARAGETLFHTKGGSKLHVRACMHFDVDSDVIETTPENAGTRVLCASCAEELHGRGRTTYDDLDRALEALPVPVEARTRVRELVADLPRQRIWIPYSRSYVAIGNDDRRTVYVGKTYLMLGDEFVPLPGYSAGEGTTSSSTERARPFCPVCGYELLATGACGYC